MSYGLRITNPSGELVISSDAKLLSYLGKATRTSTAQATSSLGGSSTYTFTYAGLIVPALKLSTTQRGTVFSMSQAGSTWTIKVSWWTTTAPLDANGFRTQNTNAEVFVYGFPLTRAADYGMLLFDSGGNLAADLTRRPLIVKERRSFSAGVNSVALAGAATMPALLGRTYDLTIIASPVGSGLQSDFSFQASGFGLSGGSLVRTPEQRRFQRANTENFSPGSHLGAADFWIVDVQGLA